MYTYDTVSEAVRGLKGRGYSLDFNLEENCLACNEDKFGVEDFEITEVYRFEGNSDPDDEAAVYAIKGNRGHRGVLVTAYGPLADPMSTDMLKKLAMHH
jgi:hypothetical protein